MIPVAYNYAENFLNHIGDLSIINQYNKCVLDTPYNDVFWPRQIELHLPGNLNSACNLKCKHCSGVLFGKYRDNWEYDGLRIIEKLNGNIPFITISGSYTEPMLNPYFITFIRHIKETGANFGVHTNGSLMFNGEENYGVLSEIVKFSTNKDDYFSISIDAGTRESFSYAKRCKESIFDDICKGINILTKKRDNGPSVRVCYLMTEETSSDDDIKNIVNICKAARVDSLRFSIPFANYLLPFNVVQKHYEIKEDFYKDNFYHRVEPYLSDGDTKVFWTWPEQTSTDVFNFSKCVYGYYQATIGADGYLYRCASGATPNKRHFRIGKLDNNIDNFIKILKIGQDLSWDCKSGCFDCNIRCNKAAIDINTLYDKWSNANGL